MARMKLIVFDLDGTLIDSATDIALSVNELRDVFSLEPLPVPTIESFVGDGISSLIARAIPALDPQELPQTVERYRDIYRGRLLENTRAYPGVVPGLRQLEGAGIELAVLTNKPARESLLILEGLDLRAYFFAVYGGDSFARKKPDPVGLAHLLEQSRTPLEDALFVGDSKVDLETAQNLGMTFCLVSYGIGPRAEPPLTPDFLIDDLRELPALVASAP